PMTAVSGHPMSGLEALAQGAILSPFTRARRLIEGSEPGKTPVIDMTIGEPREQMPAFVTDKIREAEALFAKYPAIRGSDALRASVADWITRRYGPAVTVDPRTEVLPVNGSREGLVFALWPAGGRKRVEGRP